MSSYGMMKVEVKWEPLSYTSEKNKDDYNNVLIGWSFHSFSSVDDL